MGCCFSSESEEKKPQPTTPLLHSSSQQTKPGGYTADNTEPKSARKYKPTEDVEKDLLTSVDMLSNSEMQRLPIPSLDKTFQDQGKVFDDLFKEFQLLKKNMNNFKSNFTEETAGIPVMAECVKLLVQKCGETKLDVERKKFSVHLTFDKAEIMRNTADNPQKVLEALDLFNGLNRNIQRILERAPEVERSSTILLGDEDNLRKEITKSDLSGEDGPRAMRDCMDNIHTLRRINSHLKTITKHTEKYFKEVMQSSKAFFQEDSDEMKE